MSFAPGGGGSGSLATSTDVVLSGPTDGHFLRFNGITGKWTNAEQYSAIIFYNTGTSSWPARSTVGNPLTVEWRGPNASQPPIDGTYARTGYDTFYAIA